MTWTRFQRFALIAFVAVEVLVFVGATVRATGSGLGCPDWPFCYGCWIPPRSAQDIDFDKIDLEKFRAKAARLGRDPASITRESLRAEFNPVSTWVEYFNRLTSVPVALSVLAMTIAGFGQIKAGRPWVTMACLASLLLLVMNAWLGARVVVSGLKPGTITLHMALAVAQICVIIFALWRGTPSPWCNPLSPQTSKRVITLALVIFALVVVEGVMGSQVRELTDELARKHASRPRAEWTAELERSAVYLVHRSFSWLIFGGGIWFAVMLRRGGTQLRSLEKGIVGLIVLQMFLGVVLSQVGIVRVAQILHIGASSLLVSGLFLWLLATRRETSAG